MTNISQITCWTTIWTYRWSLIKIFQYPQWMGMISFNKRLKCYSLKIISYKSKWNSLGWSFPNTTLAVTNYSRRGRTVCRPINKWYKLFNSNLQNSFHHCLFEALKKVRNLAAKCNFWAKLISYKITLSKLTKDTIN